MYPAQVSPSAESHVDKRLNSFAYVRSRTANVCERTAVIKKFHGSRETRLEAGFSASVGTPPPFKDQGADAAPKAACCDPQLIGNSWPGTRKTWMQ